MYSNGGDVRGQKLTQDYSALKFTEEIDQVSKWTFKLQPSPNSYYTFGADVPTSGKKQQGIHRHQTLPWYCNTASVSSLKVQPSTHRHIAHYGQM